MSVSTAEIQKARSFLFSHHKRGFGIAPARFAGSAKELGVSFRELMHFISILYSRGQGQQALRLENLRRISSGGQQ